MDKLILEIENALANKYKYIVWVGGCDDYYLTIKMPKKMLTNGNLKAMMT
jgi:hypothetical protein